MSALIEQMPDWGWSLVQMACYLLGLFSAYSAGKAKGAMKELREGIHVKHAFTSGMAKGYSLCLAHDDTSRREYAAALVRMEQR